MHLDNHTRTPGQTGQPRHRTPGQPGHLDHPDNRTTRTTRTNRTSGQPDNPDTRTTGQPDNPDNPDKPDKPDTWTTQIPRFLTHRLQKHIRVRKSSSSGTLVGRPSLGRPSLGMSRNVTLKHGTRVEDGCCTDVKRLRD